MGLIKLTVAVVVLLLAGTASRAEEHSAHLAGPGADLRGRSFERLDITGADLRAADLRGVDFRGAAMPGANLEGADLRGALLQGADLRNVNLRGANLQHARLARADLSGADLTLADLRNVDFFLEGQSASPEAVAEAGDRPLKSERVAPDDSATREFSVRGAVLDRALQSRPVCVYPPTSAVDVLHDFDRSKGLPLVATASGEAPAAFIEARTNLLATIGCSDAKGEATFGLVRRALGTVDAPRVAGFDAEELKRLLAAHDCAGAWALPEAERGALTKSVAD